MTEEVVSGEAPEHLVVEDDDLCLQFELEFRG
jgi:hypothetical protein